MKGTCTFKTNKLKTIWKNTNLKKLPHLQIDFAFLNGAQCSKTTTFKRWEFLWVYTNLETPCWELIKQFHQDSSDSNDSSLNCFNNFVTNIFISYKNPTNIPQRSYMTNILQIYHKYISSSHHVHDKPQQISETTPTCGKFPNIHQGIWSQLHASYGMRMLKTKSCSLVVIVVMVVIVVIDGHWWSLWSYCVHWWLKYVVVTITYVFIVKGCFFVAFGPGWFALLSAKTATLPYNILLLQDNLLAFSASEATLITLSKVHQSANHHKRSKGEEAWLFGRKNPCFLKQKHIQTYPNIASFKIPKSVMS